MNGLAAVDPGSDPSGPPALDISAEAGRDFDYGLDAAVLAASRWRSA